MSQAKHQRWLEKWEEPEGHRGRDSVFQEARGKENLGFSSCLKQRVQTEDVMSLGLTPGPRSLLRRHRMARHSKCRLDCKTVRGIAVFSSMCVHISIWVMPALKHPLSGISSPSPPALSLVSLCPHGGSRDGFKP